MTTESNSHQTALRTPVATYRLQFNRDFTFAQAAEVIGYLRELGISECYASPLFEAAPGSGHGYDVCDFGQLSSVLGGMQGFEDFSARLQQSGMGLLFDMVPNHMSTHACNRWWRDVLEKGTASRFASWFDIDWESVENRKRVLLPVLHDDEARVIQNGDVRLAVENGSFCVAYGDRTFPLAAESVALIRQIETTGGDVLREFNGTAELPGSFDRLGELLRQQHYRLASWRVAAEQFYYRRFFDVSDLIALRMERPDVFAACHDLVFQLIKSGRVTGLRIDHPDGLWDPKNYVIRLGNALTKQNNGDDSGRSSNPPRSVWVVLEKILGDDEFLPEDIAVDGTTGYDFLNQVNGLFVDGRHGDALDTIYSEFTGATTEFADAAWLGRKKVLETSFAAELKMLARQLHALSPVGEDFTVAGLSEALGEVIAGFPVYRTYVNENSRELSAHDRRAIHQAIRSAKSRAHTIDPARFDFIESVLMLQADGDEASTAARQFVMRLQQFTGAVMAKGVEDTAFYNFNRLISLNEVGGNPGRFGVSAAEFHAYNQSKATRWHRTLLTTSTHDTKRGEDVRARIDVLSELPGDWACAVRRWHGINALVSEPPVPSANDEYFLYQTLIGAWPADAESPEGLKKFRRRILDYMIKAVREAKSNTSWIQSDETYERAIREFIYALLSDGGNPFLEGFKPFQRRVAFFGRINSLAQVLLKMTSPGVPDFYQGTELWDFNLVDPDNRRPVDYSLRRQLFAALKEQSGRERGRLADFARGLLEADDAGMSKLYLIWRVLEFRNQAQRLFDDGDYVALSASGEKESHVVAFSRQWKADEAIAITPRLVVGLVEGRENLPLGHGAWGKTRLILGDAAAGRYRNVLTGEVVSVGESEGARGLEMGEVLKNFPVALLTPVT